MTVSLEEFTRRMQSAIDVLVKELSGLRAGRASANLLDPIKVDAYGTYMPLSQVGQRPSLLHAKRQPTRSRPALVSYSVSVIISSSSSVCV